MSLTPILKREIWCKDCETILGEITEEKDSSFTIQPYLTLQAQDSFIQCPNCPKVIDLKDDNSIRGQLRLFKSDIYLN